jgi:cytochrome b involved in lipid metabolism
MNKGVITLIVLGLVVLGGVAYMVMSSEEQPVVEEPVVTEDTTVQEASDVTEDVVVEDVALEEESEVEAQTYTAADIAAHSVAEDCWLSIAGKVYDVTEYIAGGLHPGGEAILNGCGLEDATPLFEGIKDGEGHPENAWGYLENFYIGDVATE